MKLNSSKYAWVFFLVSVIVLGLVAGVFFMNKKEIATGPRVSPTSPKEVGDAYEAGVRFALDSSKVQSSCGAQVDAVTKSLQELRVPKEKRDVHLKAFLSLSKIPRESSSVDCYESLRQDLAPLVSSPL